MINSSKWLASNKFTKFSPLCATTASTTSFVGQVLNRTFDLCASMIPEPNLWADLRDRDRGLDEVEYPPHHLEVAPSNTRWGISLNFVSLL